MTSDLAPLLYAELHRLASTYMAGRPAGETLQPTALVHEAWVRLTERASPPLTDREHFLALAATVMRQLLVDQAREKAAQKRGGDWKRVTLAESISDGAAPEVDLLALDEALAKLARLKPERARLVELRYFAGSTLEEAAAILGISRAEAARRWRLIRAWLAKELRDAKAP